MNEPFVESQQLEYFILTWPGLTRIEVDRIYEERNHTYCELTATSLLPGLEGHLHQATFNLSSTAARRTLIKAIETRTQDMIEWDEVLEYTCKLILESRRSGNPILEVGLEDERVETPYAIYPISPQRKRTIIFGDGSSGKSYLTLLLCIAAQLPEDSVWKKLGLSPNPQYVNALYLDYEEDEDEIKDRIARLRRGLGLPAVILKYQSRAQAIADSVPELRRQIMRENIGLIAVDSIGPALGGDPNDNALAIRFMNSLRSLDRTTILVDHIGKHADNKLRAKGPIGGVYKFNLARSIWEVRRFQETDENEIKVLLIHRKSNNSRLSRPIGLRFMFDNNATKVERTDIHDVPQLVEALSVRDRILSYLRQGPISLQDLAIKAGMSETHLSKELSHLKKQGKAVNPKRGEWGLAWMGEDNS